MSGTLDIAGERLSIECALPWVADLIAEAAVGELRSAPTADGSLRVRVEAQRRPFDTRGWQLLTRGAWRRDGEVVIENACTAGFDVHFRQRRDCAQFTYRWRPPLRDRAAARALRSRFHLLARAVLIQYPALWWAGTRGRVPLHAAACVAGSATPLLASPGGIGRSTLVLAELASGGRATSDNLAVADGTTVWGVVEPIRVAGGPGRRMPHGRHEAPLEHRVGSLEPDCLIIVERGTLDRASLVTCGSDAAARALISSTYMAGELRRYWPFAATIGAGSGVGPAHPPIAEVAWELARALPCFLLALGATPTIRLSELLDRVGVAA